MFKRVEMDGKLVGYLYKSSEEAPWRTLGFSQVKAEYNTYLRRMQTGNENSNTALKLKIWEEMLKTFDDEA